MNELPKLKPVEITSNEERILEKAGWLSAQLDTAEQQLLNKENPDLVAIAVELNRNADTFAASALLFTAFHDKCDSMSKGEPNILELRRYEWRKDTILSIREISDIINYVAENSAYDELAFPGIADTSHQR